MAVRVRHLSNISTLTVIICILLLGPSAPAAAGKIRKRHGHHLHVGLYNKTCPQAEEIINYAVANAINIDSGVAAALVRLHFHDCFVNGCDGSILLDVTPSGEPVEQKSPANIGVRGMEVIDDAKARLENECPGTVSCADIVAFAARDAAVASGISYYPVPAGRRDGLASRAIDTKGNLPKSSSNVSEMVNVFTNKGLTLKDLVILLGAHSIGTAHCSSFDSRLYNFNQDQQLDPQLDLLYASMLSMACPKVDEPPFGEYNRDVKMNLDPITPTTLDNRYYWGLKAGKGLLYSDQVLLNDPHTLEIVEKMAFDSDEWNRQFGKAMIRMGRTDVLTGKQGEIRSYCRFVNRENFN